MKYLFILLTILLISCSNNEKSIKNKKLEEIIPNEIENQDLKDKIVANENEIGVTELPDSMFAINPNGFIVEELANPSQEVLWIFYPNGEFILDCIPYDFEDYYYLVGKWNLVSDTLIINYEKLIFNRGAGEIIEVAPCPRYQGGWRHKNYVLTIQSQNKLEKYDWDSFRNKVLSNEDKDWRILAERASSYQEFSKMNRFLNGNYSELSMHIVDSIYIQKIKSSGELRIARNEIFARYGYIFKSEELKKYFGSQEWYNPTKKDVSLYLTDIEKENIEKLLIEENN